MMPRAQFRVDPLETVAVHKEQRTQTFSFIHILVFVWILQEMQMHVATNNLLVANDILSSSFPLFKPGTAMHSACLPSVAKALPKKYPKVRWKKSENCVNNGIAIYSIVYALPHSINNNQCFNSYLLCLLSSGYHLQNKYLNFLLYKCNVSAVWSIKYKIGICTCSQWHLDVGEDRHCAIIHYTNVLMKCDRNTTIVTCFFICFVFVTPSVASETALEFVPFVR